MTSNPEATQANIDQARYWASAVGRKWIDLQEPLDTAFAEVNAALFARAAPALGEKVLDIGCGTGATSLALAERVGAEGHVVAVDISPVLLARAVERTPASLADRLDFIEADAQRHAFAPGSFDLLVSRFGVMFFADPVAAFRNLRQALRSGGRLHVAAWGPIDGNPWFTIPRDAAIARLGRPAPASPTAPGPLAFADTAYVLDILREAGFPAPTAEAVPLHLEPPGGVDAAASLMSNIGPSVRIIAELNGGPEDVAAIRQATIGQLAVYRVGTGVRVPAVVNIFIATAP